jgi:hypothetical protein
VVATAASSAVAAAAGSGGFALWCAQATIAIAAKEKIRMYGSPFLVRSAREVPTARQPDHLTEAAVDLVFGLAIACDEMRPAAWL